MRSGSFLFRVIISPRRRNASYNSRLVNKLVIANLRHRPVRTLLSILAVAVEVTMMLTLVGLSRGMVEESQKRARGAGADFFIRPQGSSVIQLSSAPMPEKLLDLVRAQPHVVAAFGQVVHPIGGLNTVTGINLDDFDRVSGGFEFKEGGSFQSPDDIIVDEYFARERKLSVGSRIELMGHNWRVSGIFGSGKLARVVLPVRRLQELIGSTGKLSQIFVKVDRRENWPVVLAELKTLLPGYPIYNMEEWLSLTSVDKIPGLSAFIKVVVGLSVVVGFLVVSLSMYTAVLERTREIGILKALGGSPLLILNLLFRETTALAIVGSVLGILMTYGTRSIIMGLVPASLTQIIVYDWWFYASAIAMGGALLGALYPGWKAARQDAIEALAYE
jgi:putative ABC transport system permease protein